MEDTVRASAWCTGSLRLRLGFTQVPHPFLRLSADCCIFGKRQNKTTSGPFACLLSLCGLLPCCWRKRGQKLLSKRLTNAQLKEEKKTFPFWPSVLYIHHWVQKIQTRNNHYHCLFSYSKFNILLPVTELLTSSLEAINNEVIPMSWSMLLLMFFCVNMNLSKKSWAR